MNIDVTLVLCAIALLIFFAMIIVMLVSLGKQGDERRKMIVGKASANTLVAVVGYLLICIIADAIRGGAVRLLSTEGNSSLVTLTVIAFVYVAHLIYYKKKFGD